MRRFVVVLGGAFLAAAVSMMGVVVAQDMPGMPGMKPGAFPPASAPAGMDLGNTVCPVSGDPVATSKLIEIYEGKVYHLCCADCPPQFKADPAKYAKAVAADPAKYGVKKNP